jgi:methylated-DNA-[protein]-cysteine S-methyltransferase
MHIPMMPTSTILTTSLGRFILMAHEQGLCGLSCAGDSACAASPEVDARRHPVLVEACQQVRAYCAGSLRRFDLPLSIHGTVFQQEVWQQLVTIPYGSTMSYGELAERIGGKQKARAVGGAAHANPLAIIIPCHRLIGAKGAMTGFAGGLPMKKALLDLESRTVTRPPLLADGDTLHASYC